MIEDKRMLLSLAEAAQALGIGRTKLHAEVKAGRLATVRVGRRRMVVPQELKAYVGRLAAEEGLR